MGLRQFVAGKENKGRAACLKAIAYTTAEPIRDKRNNRLYQYQGGERVLASGLFVPKDAPEAFRRGNQEELWNSLAAVEEDQAKRYGRGEVPTISRADVLILDKRIFRDKDGNLRTDGLKHAQQMVTDYLREQYTRKGLVASYAIHNEDNGNGNYHVHIVSSYRTLDADGWSKNKTIPFGRTVRKEYFSEKYKAWASIQRRKLTRLGVVAAMPRVGRSLTRRKQQEVKRHGQYGQWGTANIAASEIRLARNAMQNLRGKPNDYGQQRRAQNILSADAGMGHRSAWPQFNSPLRQMGASPSGVSQLDIDHAHGVAAAIMQDARALADGARSRGEASRILAGGSVAARNAEAELLRYAGLAARNRRNALVTAKPSI